MIKEELYHKTVNILVEAYFNNTLEHGNCYACAVGNIIAANKGYGFMEAKNFYSDISKGIYTGSGKLYWDKDNDLNKNVVSALCDVRFGSKINELNDNQAVQMTSTGYSFDNLVAIETAFETVEVAQDDEYMFNGLLAVIDTLDIIHQNTDTSLTANTKKRFVKA